MFGKIMTHVWLTRYGHLIEGDAEALRSTDKPAEGRTLKIRPEKGRGKF